MPSSGVLWRPDVVVTAEHALKRDEEITVTLPDGRNVAATLAGRDSGTDLAALKLDAGPNAAAELGDTADLKVGHVVLALGMEDMALGARGSTGTTGCDALSRLFRWSARGR